MILALGGLDVAPVVADRQAQAIRFALFVIGNLGIFGAALALAAPLAGAIFMLLGALAWLGAGLLLHRATDLALLTPPAILLVAAILAFVAWWRRPRDLPEADDAEPDETDEPEPRRRAEAPAAAAVAIPAFAVEPHAVRTQPEGRAEPARGLPPLPANEDWNPRRRRPPPPRATAQFRDLDEEEDEDEYEDDEGLGARFARGATSLLSFGLYAGIAAAVLIGLWTFRDSLTEPEPVTFAETEPSAAAPAESAAEPVLVPILPSAQPEPAAPSAPALVAETGTDADEDDFGDLVLPSDPNAAPRLGEATPGGAPAAPALVSAGPPSVETLAPEPEPAAAAPADSDPAGLPPPTGTPTVARNMPLLMSPRMAALRTAPGTGPTDEPMPLPLAPGL